MIKNVESNVICADESADEVDPNKHSHGGGNAHGHEIYKNLLITVEQVEVLYTNDILGFDAPDPTI
jgi:hypothetical protein